MAARWILCLLLLALPVGAAEQRLDIRGDYAIPAILNVPDSSDRVPAVLLLHGTASQKNEVGDLFKRLAAALAERGLASLRIDFAGSGDSPVDHARYTLSSAVRDASLAMNALQSQASVDAGRVAVLGFSQGGLIAQRLVLERPETPLLATWSTVAANGEEAIRAMYDRYYDEAKHNGMAQVHFDWLPAPLNYSLSWFDEMKAQRTLSDMRRYPGIIFAVAGLSDDVVPYKHSATLVAQSPQPVSRVVLLAGANHIFNVLDANAGDPQRSDQQLLQITASFLAESL